MISYVVRQRSQFRVLPIIFFSGSCNRADVEKTLKLGANAYEIKPQEFEELVKIVRCKGEFWLGMEDPGDDPSRRGGQFL